MLKPHATQLKGRQYNNHRGEAQLTYLHPRKYQIIPKRRIRISANLVRRPDPRKVNADESRATGNEKAPKMRVDSSLALRGNLGGLLGLLGRLCRAHVVHRVALAV